MEWTQLNHVPFRQLQWMNASTVAVARIPFILKVTYLLLALFGNSKSRVGLAECVLNIVLGSPFILKF